MEGALIRLLFAWRDAEAERVPRMAQDQHPRRAAPVGAGHSSSPGLCPTQLVSPHRGVSWLSELIFGGRRRGGCCSRATFLSTSALCPCRPWAIQPSREVVSYACAEFSFWCPWNNRRKVGWHLRKRKLKKNPVHCIIISSALRKLAPFHLGVGFISPDLHHSV